MLDMVEKNTIGLLLADAQRTQWNSGYSLGLYLNEISPTPNMVAGDFQEASFDGYIRQSVSFDPVMVDSAGILTFSMGRQFNSVPAGNPAQTTRGAYIMTPAGDPLVAGNLETPTAMGLLAQGLRLSITNSGGEFKLDQLPLP